MPARSRFFGLLATAALVGCAAVRGPSASEDEDGRGPWGMGAIEIEVRSSSGIYGGASTTERWVLRRNGECSGTVVSGSNSGKSAPQTEKVQFRSVEAYRECERLLRETRFFWMRDQVPKTQFESSTIVIEASQGVRHHRVSVVSPERPSAEFTRLTEFVGGLQKRASGE